MLNTPSFSDFNVTKHSVVLSNGVRVTLFERPKTPISILFSFLSGSRFDPVGKEGLAHFTEHMVGAGTKMFPSGDVLATFVGGMGGSYNAFTNLNTFTLYLSLAEPEDFPQAITLFNDIVNFALFNDKTIEAERGAILREFDMKESSPGRYLDVVARDLHYQGTLCGRPNLGYKETIETITKQDLLSYYETMITSGRAAITISGGITMENVVKTLETGLNIRKSEPFTIKEPLPIIRKKTIEIKKYTTNDQLNLNFGFRVCPKYTEDNVPLFLLGNIMGSGFASQLYKKLRLEKGLVYSLSAGYAGNSDTGIFSVNTEIAKKNLSEVLDIISDEFERASSGNITNEELEFFKIRRIKSQKRNMETSDSWTNYHAYDELLGNEKRLSLPEFLAKVNEVTLDEITRVSKKYLTRNSWYLALCGDIEEKDIVVNY